jgi:N-methylhydantoinase B/oxoprolinase/acetone carboxylase alpha subunit
MFFEPVQVSLLSERRVFAPYGMQGGQNGERGVNLIIESGTIRSMGSKSEANLKPFDRVLIMTPGGGGFGEAWHYTELCVFKSEKMNIKYLGYARYSTATLIFDVNQESSNRDLSHDSETVLSLYMSDLSKNKINEAKGRVAAEVQNWLRRMVC